MEEIVEIIFNTPKKNQKIKGEPVPATSTTPENERRIKVEPTAGTSTKTENENGNNSQLGKPNVPYPQRYILSSEICKVASKDSIRIYYQNVQSIDSDKKQKQFSHDLARNFDVIVFTETWLKETSSLEILDIGFDIYRCDRTSKNSYKEGFGGVLVAVSSQLYNDPVMIQGFDFLEYVCLKIFHRDHFVYIYCLYMPNEHKTVMSPQHIKAVEAIEYHKNDTLIVIGDFNMPNIMWKINDKNAGFRPAKTNHMLKSLLEEKQLYQLNNITNNYGNVLDLVFVSDTNTVSLLPVRKEDALMTVVDVHPPFEIVIDSLHFPHDLSVAVKERIYSSRKDCTEKLEKLFERLKLVDWKDLGISELDICLKSIKEEG